MFLWRLEELQLLFYCKLLYMFILLPNLRKLSLQPSHRADGDCSASSGCLIITNGFKYCFLNKSESSLSSSCLSVFSHVILLWRQSSLLHASSRHSLARSFVCLFVCLLITEFFLTPVPTLWCRETSSSLHTPDTLLHTAKHTQAHTHTFSHLHSSLIHTHTHLSPCVQLPLL